MMSMVTLLGLIVMSKNKVAITIRGGLVVGVYSREHVEVVIIDFDNQDSDQEEEADREFRKVLDDKSMKPIW